MRNVIKNTIINMFKPPKNYKGYTVKVDNSHAFYGTTDTKKKTIILNKQKSLRAGGEAEFKDSWKHEKYHADNPQATEKQTEKAIKHKSEPVEDKKNLAIKGLI